MGSPTPDDELLPILLINLKNAAATFGEGTPPYESIKTTIEDHLQAMRAQGAKTSLTSMRQSQGVAGSSTNNGSGMQSHNGPEVSFANLAFRPKPV